MTPSGVEHATYRAKPSALTIVIPTMTPSGVEHMDHASLPLRIVLVIPTMTPSGVEHIAGRDVVGQCEGCKVIPTMTPSGVEHQEVPGNDSGLTP